MVVCSRQHVRVRANSGAWSRRRCLVLVAVEWRCRRRPGSIAGEKVVCSQEGETSGRNGAWGRHECNEMWLLNSKCSCRLLFKLLLQEQEKKRGERRSSECRSLRYQAEEQGSAHYRWLLWCCWARFSFGRQVIVLCCSREEDSRREQLLELI